MSINPAPFAAESRPFTAAAASLNPRPPATPPAATSGAEAGFWGEDGFDFGDLLDLVNPLQHLPIVSTLYRELTGDTIAPGPRLLGGAAFGGPLGMAAAMVNLAIENATGSDLGANALALFDREGPAPEVVAAATAPETPPAQAAGAAAGAESRSPDGPVALSTDGPQRRLTAAEIAEFVVRYERSLLTARTLYESEQRQP